MITEQNNIENMKSDIELQQLFLKFLPDEVRWDDSFNCLFWTKQKEIGGSAVHNNELLRLCELIEQKWNLQYGMRSIKNYHRDYLLSLMDICNPDMTLWNNGTYLGNWSHAIKTATATWQQKISAFDHVINLYEK